MSVAAQYEDGQIVAERHQRARAGKITRVMNAQKPVLYQLDDATGQEWYAQEDDLRPASGEQEAAYRKATGQAATVEPQR